jgi:hypothetical protein
LSDRQIPSRSTCPLMVAGSTQMPFPRMSRRCWSNIDGPDQVRWHPEQCARFTPVHVVVHPEQVYWMGT